MAPGRKLAQAVQEASSASPSLKLREIHRRDGEQRCGHGRRAPHRRLPCAPPPVHLDLIKADGDGPEADWLAEIERLLTLWAVTVGALVIEGQFFNSKKA